MGPLRPLAGEGGVGTEYPGGLDWGGQSFSAQPDPAAKERAAAEEDVLLLRSDKLASVGMLASGVGHEINNPLTYVIGNLQLLQDHLGSQTTLPREASNPSTQDLLAEALEGSERVANLVRDLKTFSHSNDEVTRSVSLNEAIERSVRLVTNEIRHRSVLKVECEHELHVEGNAGRIQQVLVNLLVNAAHAIEPGSSEENLIRISVNSQSERVLIEISDTGTGIEIEVSFFLKSKPKLTSKLKCFPKSTSKWVLCTSEAGLSKMRKSYIYSKNAFQNVFF